MGDLEKLFDVLVREGKYTKSFEEFQAQFSEQDYQTKVFDLVVRDGFYTKDKESFLNKYTTQGAVVEKKNQVVTPSDGVEEVTVSTTETETPLGSSDSLEIQTPEAPVVEEEFNINIDAPNREGVQLNQDGSVSTHKMRTETLDGENWFSFPTIFQNEDGEFVDMSEQAESDWKLTVRWKLVRRARDRRMKQDSPRTAGWITGGGQMRQLLLRLQTRA